MSVADIHAMSLVLGVTILLLPPVTADGKARPADVQDLVYRITLDERPVNSRLILQNGETTLFHADRPRSRPGMTAARVEVGPDWFRRMDANRDGDVSPHEFLGKRETFRRLDADADGLFSAVEAESSD